MSEVLHGNASGDQLNASKDKTQVYGLSGNDTLISDRKSDALLVGGSGDDSLIMLGGNGTLSGGDGADIFELNYSATEKISAVIEDLDPMKDKIVVNFDGNFALPISSVTSGSDVVWTDGANLNLTLKSVRENDYFDGEVSDEAWEVLRLTNNEREKENLPWLTMSDGLTKGASIRAQEITEKGEIGLLTDHTRLDNSSYSTVLEGKYHKFGENLQAGAESSAEVMDAWIGSTSHYANIMNPVFLKLGVGYNYKDLSKNEYYWTQLFADSLNNPEIVSAENLSGVRPEGHTVRKFIPLTKRGDIYNNNEYGATIAALGGNDKITNTGLIASISGGKDDDIIDNSGSFVTINAGTGNDEINLSRGAKYNLIEYNIGDGSDNVSGLHSTDTLSISGHEYTPVTVGNDVIVSVGAGSIKLVDAPKTFTIAGVRSKFFLLTEGDDKLNNTVDGATIQAMGGDDKITISGENVLFVHESGDDTVRGFNDTSTLKVLGKNYSSITSGNDFILTNADKKSSITILNAASLNAINIVDANDRPLEVERVKNIIGTDDPDNLKNGSDDVTIQALGGDDTVTNKGDGVLIDGGADNDSISNDGSDVTIIGGGGSDTIKNTGDNNSILGGADDDTIEISGDENTINAEGGDDFISVKGSRNVIEYVAGSGKDVIEGFNQTSTLRISGDVYTSTTSNKDIVVTVGEQTISLVGAADLRKINIVGTSQTETISSNYMDYNGHRYQLFDEGMTWKEAKAYCESLGGHLVVITDAAEQAAVEGLLKEKGTKNSYWMGGFKSDNSKLITLTEGDDTYNNSVEGVTIQALGGNDTIYNQNMNVLIDANNGDDVIYNYGFNETIDGGFNTTILGGAGDDTVYNYEAGMVYVYRPYEGDDFISGFGILESLVIDGADFETEKSGSDVLVKVGKNTITLAGAAGLAQPNIVTSTSGINPVNIIRNHDSNTLINGLSSSNWIRNSANEVTITAGASSDDIYNDGSNVVIKGGGGNDQIRSYADSVSIDGGAGDDFIYSFGEGNSISGGDGDDTISSAVYGTLSSDGLWNTINAGLGDDYISLSGGNNEIFYNAGDGSDTITGLTSNDTINILGTTYTRSTIDNDVILSVDDDSITLRDAANLSLNINGEEETTSGDTIGVSINNTISSTLITGTSGDDSIYNMGDNVTIDAGAGNDYVRNSGDTSTINTGDGKDSVWNYNGDSVTIDTGAGNDSVLNDNSGSDIIITGAGNDSVYNIGRYQTINTGTGNDFVSLNTISDASVIEYNTGDGNDLIVGFESTNTLSISGSYSTQTSGNDVLVKVGEGTVTLKNAYATADTIQINNNSIALARKVITMTATNNDITISRDSLSVVGSSSNDSVWNDGSNVAINTGAGDDYVNSNNAYFTVTINTGDGNDSVWSAGDDSRINTETGNDSISNHGSNVSINSGAGDDSIYNYNKYTTISTGAGNDFIYNVANFTTLDGGAGNDLISLNNSGYYVNSEYNNSKNTLIQYTSGDGNDTIWGFNDDDTLSIAGAAYSTTASGSDIIVSVGDDSIRLVDAVGLSLNIDGEEDTTSGNVSGVDITNSTSNTVVTGTSGDDSITNSGDNVTIQALGGNDTVWNDGEDVTIDGGAGNDSIYYHGPDTGTTTNVSINGGANSDTIYNRSGDTVTLNGGAGNDLINNWEGYYATILGGEGNDTLNNDSSKYVTLDGGTGDDQISLTSSALYNLIQYTSGDGDDTITGFNSTSTLSIAGAAYSTTTSGNDVIVTVGDGKITLQGAANLDAINIEGTLNSSSENGDSWQWVTGETWDYTNFNDNEPDGSGNYLQMYDVIAEQFGEKGKWDDTANDLSTAGYDTTKQGLICEWETIPNSKLIVLTEKADTYGESMESGTTLKALGGNDNINNWRGDSVTIDLGADDDYILNHSSYVLIEGADGSDTVASWIDDDYSAYNTIRGGAGDDSIDNHGHHTLIEGNNGNDTINNYVGDDGGIHQGYEANYSTVRGGRGNDEIDNHGNHVLIEGGTGNDTIYNNNGAWFDDEAEYSTIYGGAGNDSIINHGASSIIDGANGNDSIHNYSSSVSIGGGADDDYIYNEGSQVLINGNAGDDSIDNHGKNDTILGGTGNDEISLSTASKNNFIRYADGDGNDTVWGATPDDTINILGVESYSSVKSGKNDLLIKVGNGSILLKDARNRPPKITLGESGSSGGTGGGMGGSGSGSGGSNSGGSNSSGGTSSSSNSNSAASGGNSASGSSGTSSGLSGSSGRGSRLSTRQISATTSPPAQTVRNQVLSNYQSGSKINSNEGHTGAFFDGKGNFYSGSTTGAIVIPDATNKLIDLRDAAGNPFIKAYRASNAGVIDGRSFAGFEIINGSAGSDEIYAGVNGSQITGGTGNDTLTGGRGIDIFVSGKSQGNDLIRNASLLDKISLTDVTLNDITSTRENDKTVLLTFRTGSVITVESKDILSPSFVLSDGSYFFYNSISKSWRVMNQASDNQKVYGGGEQTISSYQSGEKILFNAEYRGGSYDGEGNFRVNSSAGSLVVQNATDKVIDLTNSAGNSIVKAYAASTSGVINGKDLTGYQIINGSAGADVICAGNGGSQLWGGAEADVLIGGDGADTFITGRTHGADLISNASTADNINLNDATLSDIVGTSESNGTISLSFNTGNVINVQSSEALSARFTLSDGSAYRYNHARKTWQSA